MGKAFSSFVDKVVVISGAASGMGRSYALNLAKRGARLALCDLDEIGLKQTLNLVQGQSEKATLSIPMDVSSEAAWNEFANTVKRHIGPANIVINNAGIEGSAAPVWDTSADTLERTMNVNFYGVVNGCRAFLPQLVQQQEAALINVSSIFGFIGTPSAADYCASKFAVRGYTEALMAELADVYPHVQVHLVHPGGINTQITRKPQSKAFAKAFLTTSPDEIAEQVITAVQNNRRRMVFGNQALRTFLASRVLPLSWQIGLIRKTFKNIKVSEDYRPDHPGFKLKDDT